MSEIKKQKICSKIPTSQKFAPCRNQLINPQCKQTDWLQQNAGPKPEQTSEQTRVPQILAIS